MGASIIIKVSPLVNQTPWELTKHAKRRRKYCWSLHPPQVLCHQQTHHCQGPRFSPNRNCPGKRLLNCRSTNTERWPAPKTPSSRLLASCANVARPTPASTDSSLTEISSASVVENNKAPTPTDRSTWPPRLRAPAVQSDVCFLDWISWSANPEKT